MNYINKNIKTIGMVNIALTVLVAMLEIFSIFDSASTNVDRIFNVAILLSLIAGLIYSFCLYRKNAAKYYKFFMIIYALTAIDIAVVHTIGLFTNSERFSFGFMYVISVISAIYICILAFALNLGKKNSYTLALTNFGLSIMMFIYDLTGLGDGIQLPATIYGSLVLSWLCVVFIARKYADKDARGAK